MNRTIGRVVVSNNPTEVLNLASKVYLRHQNDGATSPLTNLDGVDWSAVGPTIATTLAKHLEAEALKGQMEMAYRERDLYLPAIKEAVKASRNLLKALNQKNPKRLIEWGFDVNDSVQPTKAAKAK